MHIFVEKFEGQSLEFSGDDFNHVVRSLRKKIGDFLTLVPLTADQYYKMEITALGKRSCLLEKRESIQKPDRSTPQIILYQAIVKKTKMEIILQKVTELGVSKIVPIRTENIVPDSRKVNLDRWRTIIKEAAMQSERFDIPELAEPIKLKDIDCINKDNNPVIALFAREKEQTLQKYLGGVNRDLQSIGVIVGPEGGLSAQDLKIIRELKISTLSFGETILRAETAAIAGLSVLRFVL